ncbi:hypothetical protein QVD17_06658 [Tagetes erecta]|uniref:Uncharacterized protein n=1 Tax=Tagetes erecta TaxID=13708 RepID=A0AAD8LKM0_TARER|nr:hypothetical protein QVD17_06658 [Tagetes erecta]
MEDQQKMEALKKVYAEIILNTAKEAAARAMASERKALRVQHDLRNTKDEAIRMLMRFKHMIDVKTTEAETTSLSQQKRIKELDARLDETEGVIMDLRAEIRKARERLEEMKNSHVIQSDEPSGNEHMHQANTDHTEQFRCSSPCSKSCNPENEITTSDANLASIIIGNKEPEIYRNRYTHRIRAIEMNPFDEKKISEEKELIANVDETVSRTRALSFVDTENKDAMNINRSEACSINSRASKDETVQTRRLTNKVGYAQSNRKLSRFCHEKMNLKKKSYGNGANLTKNNANNACTLRRSIRKRKVRCWDEISSLFKSRSSLSHCTKYSGNNGVKFEETKYEDTELQNDSVVEKHEKCAAKKSAGSVRDAANNRCLKYTFSRRHKKVLPSESYNCSSLGKSSFTGQMREKLSYNLENEKPDQIDDSSSDSQIIFDVACQLISLSGERSQ